MSWNSTPIKPADGEHITAEIASAKCSGMVSPEHEDQLRQAKAAAIAMIMSGALGDPLDGRVFTVSLHGHANEGHQPKPGWADDALSVYVQSFPADADAVRYAREAFEHYQAMQQAEEVKG